jgi:DNA-binding response OmpR family regulator/tetratricopeptide (TPR) repeat protein
VRKRVLIVEDDPGTRQLLGAILSDFDVDIHEASRDDEGYQRFLEVGPDLVFLDVLLPRRGGLELLRRIRGVRGGKEVPVFVMSAVYRGADIRTEAVDELGAVDFLKKPFQLDVLQQRIAQVLADGSAEAPEAVTCFAPTEILNKGSLSAVAFPLLLKDVAFHKTTGCLNLRSGRVKKVLFLQDGEIQFALSNQMRETLGRHLLESGRIDEETYRVGIDEMVRTGMKLGEFLTSRELIEPRVLFEAVRENVIAKILEVFTWEGGDFRTSPWRDPPAHLPGQPLEVRRILWDGVRERLPYERVTASFAPHLALNLVPQRDLFDLATEVSLEKEDLQFLRLLRRLRGRSLGDVLGEVQGEGEVRFLYYLLLRNYLGLSRGDGREGAAHGLDATDLERVRRGRHRLDVLRSRNYFQVLEVPLTATDEKVRESYLHFAKEVHPDMLAPNDPSELHSIHAETFQVIQAAYEGLKTETRRREYLKFIQEGLGEEVSDGSKILQAEALFQEGKMLLKRRAWDEAGEAFRKALDLNPDEGEYALNLGIAKLQSAAAGRTHLFGEAEELLVRARTLMPMSPEPFYRLGRLLMLRGDLEGAASHMQAALSRNPNHVEALREMRIIRMRSGKKGGVLGALLGKR